VFQKPGATVPAAPGFNGQKTATPPPLVRRRRGGAQVALCEGNQALQGSISNQHPIYLLCVAAGMPYHKQTAASR